MNKRTDQENFWAGNFGDNYVERNNNKKLLESNLWVFKKALKSINTIDSVLEFGANIGLNLQAINSLFPQARLDGIEINKKAASQLKKWMETTEGVVGDCYSSSIFEFKNKKSYDLVLIKTVLIHINPQKLKEVYEMLYNKSNRYILIVEYFNSTPVEIEYRGHKDKLFKRDFAGEMMNSFNNLKLLDYGFIYCRDPIFLPQDDMNWFLLEK